MKFEMNLKQDSKAKGFLNVATDKDEELSASEYNSKAEELVEALNSGTLQFRYRINKETGKVVMWFE